MFAVGVEQDRVIVDLCGRRRDLLLRPDDATEFTIALRKAATEAVVGPLTLMKGESWSAQVESYDGCVSIRFNPPLTGWVDRVPLTPLAARRIADLVESNVPLAIQKMKINLIGRYYGQRRVH